MIASVEPDVGEITSWDPVYERPVLRRGSFNSISNLFMHSFSEIILSLSDCEKSKKRGAAFVQLQIFSIEYLLLHHQNKSLQVSVIFHHGIHWEYYSNKNMQGPYTYCLISWTSNWSSKGLRRSQWWYFKGLDPDGTRPNPLYFG